MEIIPDPIPVLLLVMPFLVTYVALRFILFQPLMAYLEERQGVSARALAEARDFEAATADKLTDLEQRLAVARRDAGEIRKTARAGAHDEEVRILADARSRADAHVAEAVERIAGEKKAASTTLRGTAKVLSTDIASQILGRSARGQGA